MKGLKLKAEDRKVKKIWYDGKECIWVEGFKGTKNDMTCNDFQYILNQEHFYDGKVDVCRSGFHFCKKLKDVFDYYAIENGNRFFKVKALVYKDDFHPEWEEKFAAKKIILTEELTFEDLKKYIQERMDFVETEDDWKKIQEIGYEDFRRNIFVNDMKTYGYGETFINVLYDNNGYDNLSELLKKAKAFYEEGISKEMSVYFLMTN